MGVVILTCLNVIGAIGEGKVLASGLEIGVLSQSSSKEPTQECEFL
jgi:hypothetical protein